MKYDRAYYENEIKELHRNIHDNTDEGIQTKLKNSLNGKLNNWYNKLDICVFVARNEQLPWSEKDIGLATRPMLPKSETSFSQVGDYIFLINGSKPLDQSFGGLVIERKTCADLYGTLMNRKHRDRLYREIDRFHGNPRFNQFRIFAECDIMTFLNYRPPTASDNNPLINEKMGVIASLSARGSPIMFCGSRKAAAKMYKPMVKQWTLKHYAEVLGLE